MAVYESAIKHRLHNIVTDGTAQSTTVTYCQKNTTILWLILKQFDLNFLHLIDLCWRQIYTVNI